MKYVIIHEQPGDFIFCEGVCGFYEAIGRCVYRINESNDTWKKNGYRLESQKDFYELEGAAGYGWYRKYESSRAESIIHEYWYILETMEQ